MGPHAWAADGKNTNKVARHRENRYNIDVCEGIQVHTGCKVREWINYLRYQQKLGIKEVYLPCSIDKFMELTKRKRTVAAKLSTKPSVILRPADEAGTMKDPEKTLPNALPALEKMVSTCVKCKLSQGRTQTV